MTSRIEADGESKEAKWADIDDDEDDWAPETIEWADGTKVTLNPMSNMPLPHEATKLEKLPGEPTEEAQSERPKAAKAAASVGPNATVLKLGASAERQQAQKATILQKGPNDKPAASSAKSPAPVPTKSPWAPLPPVDKVSPITIAPQVPVPSSTRYGQVPQGGPSPSMPVAPSPAKEISADDFNRSWRDSQPGQPRELFMPNSGRYEAVNENRRRGSRNDQNFRAPALLQRPSPGDQHAPAEPSPAFQTSRVSADQERGPWNRRRASSIQSGGSGQFGRRMSVSKGLDTAPPPSDSFPPHRGSSQAGATDAATSSRGVHLQQPPPTTGPPDAAVIAEQKRLMQESARQAIQRRREEEEKEEAAKRERIRIKLEQLGPPPEQKGKAQEQKKEIPPAAPKPEESTVQVSSPPKPPIPEASDEPQQYGMMKVHPPDNVKKLNPPIEKPETSPETKVSDVASPPNSEPLKSSAPTTNGNRLTGEASVDRPSSEPQNNIVLGEEKTQPWKRHHAVNETVPGWSSRNNYHGSNSSNLWGLPNHDKALGNGTFDQRLTGLSARDLSMRNNSQQPNWFNGRPQSHEMSPQMPSIPPTSQENLQPVESFPSPEQRPIAANSEADLQPIGKPLPIGPPQTQSSANQRWQHPSNGRAPNAGVAAWNNFHAVAAREDRAENERFQRDLAASLEEEARTGIRRGPQYTFNETWKQVEIGDQAGDRQVTSVAKVSINPSFPAGHPYGAPSTHVNGDRATNGLPVRGSRFFPTEARRAVTYSHPEISRSPSPPPAEELGSHHPAYDGDVRKPVINFPVPKAVVNLPKPQQKPTPLPTPPTPPAPPRTFAAAAAAQPPPPQPSLRTVSQPLASTPDWQHRFNDLFGRKSPPKKQVLAVASSSREPLDVMPLNASAAVSLPPKEVDLLKDAGQVTSRNFEEQEDLFEDREAASVPLVQLPRDAPEHISDPMQSSQLRSKGRYFHKTEIDPVSVPPYDPDDYTRGPKGKDIIFYIHLPGSTKSIKKTMPRKGGFNNNNNNGFMSKGPKNHTNNYTRNNNNNKKGPPNKSRESSGSYQNVQQNNSRGGSNHHNNRTRTPPQQGNGSVLTPRAGLAHRTSTNSSNGGWRGGGHLASAGVAH